MLATKMFEVRDRHTLIAVMATKLEPTCSEVRGATDSAEAERYLLGRSGFRDGEYLILTKIDPVVSHYDAYAWDTTLREAHQHILENFNTLESGAVVDLEYIRGEAEKPKESERVS